MQDLLCSSSQISLLLMVIRKGCTNVLLFWWCCDLVNFLRITLLLHWGSLMLFPNLLRLKEREKGERNHLKQQLLPCCFVIFFYFVFVIEHFLLWKSDNTLQTLADKHNCYHLGSIWDLQLWMSGSFCQSGTSNLTWVMFSLFHLQNISINKNWQPFLFN